MTIAIDARIIFSTTGRYIYRLLEQLQTIDAHNQYIVLLRQKDFDNWNPTAPNFRKHLADYAPYTMQEQVQFAGLLRTLKPDLVHFTMPNHPLLYRGKFILTVHDLTLVNFVNARRENPLADTYKQRIKPAVFKQVLRSGLNRAEHIITPTEFVRQQIIDQYGVLPQKISRTYEAGEIVDARPVEMPQFKDKKFLLYVGNAYPYKNLEKLVEAHAELRTKHPDLELVLAGKHDYFYEQLVAKVSQERLDGVHLPGFVSDGELAWLYQNAALYVFPSLSEGFGLPGLEAMSYGLAVAASSATCLPEVYGDAAVYFNPDSSSDIAHSIDKLLGDTKRLKALGAAGKAHVAGFSWKRMAEETLAIYERAAR